MIKPEDLQYFNPTLFAENIFLHQALRPASERAYMHYVLKEQRNNESPTEYVKNIPSIAEEEVFKWLNFLADNPFGEFIRDYVAKIWPTISEQIETFSTFNVQIEGSNPYCNINKKSMFLHYHPARLDTGKSMTATFISPMLKYAAATEVFHYADLQYHGRESKSMNTLFADCKTKLDYAYAMYNDWHRDNYKDLEWNDIAFPNNGTLALRFDGSRYVHSVENISDNVYVVLVFNDVVFTTEYDPASADDFIVEHRSIT